MTTLRGGPGHGVALNLRRCPRFLRVVQTPSGTWDALDQLADRPQPDETVFAYQRVGRPLTIHVDFAPGRGGRRRSLWTVSAVYEPVANPPDAATLRETQSWRDWCLARDRDRDRQTANPEP